MMDPTETEVTFAPIAARHVRLVVTEFSARDASPQVAELEVFGVGLDQQKRFVQPLCAGRGVQAAQREPELGTDELDLDRVDAPVLEPGADGVADGAGPPSCRAPSGPRSPRPWPPTSRRSCS